MAGDIRLPQPRALALVAAWRSFFCDASGSAALPSARELDALARDVLALQRGLTGERKLAGSGYMDSPGLLGAYLLYYWPVSWAQASRAIRRSGMAGALKGARVLDLGSGPGPVAAAVLDAGAGSAFLVDRSEPALNLAASLLGPALAGKAVMDLADKLDGLPGPFDLVTIGHALNELSGDQALDRRLAVFQNLVPVLAPGGRVLAMEPATLAASRGLMELRDALLSQGWSVLAPCVTQEPCPARAAGPQHSCHDEVPWTMPTTVAELARRAGLDRDLIKHSWMVFQAPGHAPPPSFAYRVVSEQLVNKAGRARRLLCGQGGRFPLSAKLGDSAAAKTGFFSLERYDLIRVDGPEEREGGWGVSTNTSITRL
ncbi:MAG TPA: small ribosomal subunit Rsm22 family protein [Spirochaetales bacterium]|nr:small ribosomal subunit Rsm22 family protein [Spirochaetales bacterium]